VKSSERILRVLELGKAGKRYGVKSEKKTSMHTGSVRWVVANLGAGGRRPKKSPDSCNSSV